MLKSFVCGKAVKGKGGRPNTGYQAHYLDFLGSMLQLMEYMGHVGMGH